MIAWILAFLIDPMLACFALYLCRGPRRYRSLTRAQIAEWQILADIEGHEDLP